MESVDRFKAAMDSDRGALGPFMICTDPAMVEAAGHAGYDFVLLDMEHGTTTFQELPNLIRAANVTGVCPVVRVPRGSDIWIDQALDVGAGAVMIPQIDTAEQARAAVSAAKPDRLRENSARIPSDKRKVHKNRRFLSLRFPVLSAILDQKPKGKCK